jgi:uracil-DNA glycosylase
VLALGRIAHESVVRAFGLRTASFPFAHAARHVLGAGGPSLFDSYHCSRYNTNTGRLTDAMFRAVFAAIRAELDCLRGRGEAAEESAPAKRPPPRGEKPT